MGWGFLEGFNGYLLLLLRLVHTNAAPCARHCRRSEHVSKFPAHAWRRWPMRRRAMEYWERRQELADRCACEGALCTARRSPAIPYRRTAFFGQKLPITPSTRVARRALHPAEGGRVQRGLVDG